MRLSQRALKALGYRVLSFIAQVIFVYLITGTWSWTPAIIGLNAALVVLYMAYDRLWEKLMQVKWNIKSPKAGLLPTKVRASMDLLRPATLLPAAVVGVAGARIVGLDWPLSLLFGLVLVLMQGGGQALNQSNEREIELDRVNGKTYRPTVSGILASWEARLIAYTCLAVGVGFALALGVWWLGLLMASTAVFYTQEPFYLKRFFPANLFVQALGRGFLPVYTLGYLTGKDTLPLGLFLFLWVFSLQSTKDFHDYEGDRSFGVKTLPVLVGKRAAKAMMFAITVGDYVFAVAAGMWPLLVIAPLDVSAILTCEKEVKLGENSLGWLLYYASLGIGTVVGLAY